MQRVVLAETVGIDRSQSITPRARPGVVYLLSAVYPGRSRQEKKAISGVELGERRLLIDATVGDLLAVEALRPAAARGVGAPGRLAAELLRKALSLPIVGMQ
jgi:hypothetical protein